MSFILNGMGEEVRQSWLLPVGTENRRAVHSRPREGRVQLRNGRLGAGVVAQR